VGVRFLGRGSQPFPPARWFTKHCKFPRRGLGQSPVEIEICRILEVNSGTGDSNCSHICENLLTKCDAFYANLHLITLVLVIFLLNAREKCLFVFLQHIHQITSDVCDSMS